MRMLALLSIITLVACAKKTTSVAGMYKGVVIKNTCCLIAIHSIGANALGPAWTDSGSTMVNHYDHAFRVANPCQFGSYAAGDKISFNMVQAQVQNCVCCMVYTTTPDTTYAITVGK